MSVLKNRHRIRKSFGAISAPLDVPDLLRIQKDSFERFLQRDVPPDQRGKEGLEAVFRSIFPISDFSSSSTLEYVHYRLGDPKYDVEECRVRGVTFACPIRVALRLIIWEREEDSETKHIRDIKEQDIYLGEIPLMTSTGSFIINGTERVIVSQMHKSPGAFFTHDKGKGVSGRVLYSARLIPQRGSWLDFEFDAKDFLYVRIDRRRKFPATILLMALGRTEEQILEYFYPFETINLGDAQSGDALESMTFQCVFNPKLMLDQRIQLPITDPESGEMLVKPNQRINKRLVAKLEKAGVTHVPCTYAELTSRVLARTVMQDDQLIAKCNTPVSKELLDTLLEQGICEFEVLHMAPQRIGPSLRATLELDKTHSPEQALIEVYKKMKPGDPPTLEAAQTMLQNFFFNEERYSLSKVGRLKINKKLEQDYPLE
ncbi:MAG: DNA-directed RNA polymerase subunit beta, partial [SAR324 cluster bacterium]|nr:DNA-directed RNA polymerase subunit beta [SAR324 cluster bacterium]